MPRSLVLVITLLAAVPAWAQEPRLDFRHPVVGESMEIIVDRVRPREMVVLTLEHDGIPLTMAEPADASGCVRFSIGVEPLMAGQVWTLSASSGGRPVSREVRFQWPQMLVTGSIGAEAHLFRVEVNASPERFRLVERVALGARRAGAAVRDGRGTRTFVVADRAAGVVSVISDPEADGGTFRTLLVPPDVRSITRTPDGAQVLVASAGDGGGSFLTILDAATDDPSALLAVRIALAPFGPTGGKVVVGEDGLQAFVAVQGQFVLPVSLLRQSAGRPIAVGGPGQDEIRDLKIADGFLFALTGRGDRVSFVTGLEVGNLGNKALEGPAFAGSSMAVGRNAGRSSLLLLDGDGGEVTVIDARSMRRTGQPRRVPAGCHALLLSPNPERSGGALLRDAPGGTEVLAIEFERFTLGAPRAYGFPLRELPVCGASRLVDWLFVIGAGGRILAQHPETLDLVELPLPPALAYPAVSVQ
ncbi:MAG: hypothetical protein HY812_04875 [Planctomycetes bacterium]|nr:hypothetical protein [Planctomycetota bacterium]